MKIIVILCNLTKCIYSFGDNIIDMFGDILDKLLNGIISIVLTILWLPFYPFFILNKFFNKSLEFFELNKRYEKHRKAFMKWYREQGEVEDEPQS